MISSFAILVVTHDHRMVENFDKIYEVRDGHIVDGQTNAAYDTSYFIKYCEIYLMARKIIIVPSISLMAFWGTNF